MHSNFFYSFATENSPEMKDSSLSDLCDSLAELCEVPETNPGVLFGFQKQTSGEIYATVSNLYKNVSHSLQPKLKEKSVYPEDVLVEGFDSEQHFQQIALIGKESLRTFIPNIALSEAQPDLSLPVRDKRDNDAKADVREDDSRDEIGSVVDSDIDSYNEETIESKGAVGACSASENEESDDASDDSDASGDEDLFNFSDADAPEEDASDEEGGSVASDNPDWDQVQPKDSSEKESKKPLSSYEKSRQNLMDKIETMEEEQLEEKPWQMKGEATAATRPFNSLLEEVLEYDITQRPAPVVTEAVTMKLEDIILKRIKDQAFDDVVRKVKPVEVAPSLKKKIVLDQEKSKLSLAEVYEQEYVKQKSKAQSRTEEAMPTSALTETELTEEEKAINSRLAQLFRQLDCLSNFHYTPPPRFSEVEIVANLPAVNVEEVGQDALTSASLLTAGEIAGKFKRDLKGSTEKTKTDKKRERRKKKIHQAKKFKKLQLATAVKSAAVTPTHKGKIKLADPALKSSTQFFSQLEAQAKNHINNKRAAEEDKKNKFKAKKLKL